MKLLINLCAHDGIISHYNGVGTMTDRYIKALNQYLLNTNFDYDVNLITPQYNYDSFGYSKSYLEMHKFSKFNIIKINNGSKGIINFGTIDNWNLLSKNTADFINNIDKSVYDKVITIYNDTPFAKLANFLKIDHNHITVWIPHSTIKIHCVDSAIEKNENYFNKRLIWEEEAINFINSNKNSYVGVIGKYIKSHLIKEYNLSKNKTLKIFNGELLFDKRQLDKVDECEKLYKKIFNFKEIIVSFSRAEIYKNLEATMRLGKNINIPTIVIAQGYYKNQPLIKKYKKCAKENGSLLFVDSPFDFSWYILQNFNGKIIVILPSKKEVMGLIINEIRKLNRDNILLVANNIDGLKEQIDDKKNGLLINVDDIDNSIFKIKKYFNLRKMRDFNNNSWNKLVNNYNLENNFNSFIGVLINKHGFIVRGKK